MRKKEEENSANLTFDKGLCPGNRKGGGCNETKIKYKNGNLSTTFPSQLACKQINLSTFMGGINLSAPWWEGGRQPSRVPLE